MEQIGAWEADREYTDYQWWLARSADGGWDIVTFGY
jgi:D-alanyl-D-alanine carboxypeptidase